MIGPERVLRLSPLPIVDIDSIDVPTDGLQVNTPAECARHFARSDQCRKHYERLRQDVSLHNQPVQCPFGYCSYAFRLTSLSLALTGVVPYPRLGGALERAAAKRSPA